MSFVEKKAEHASPSEVCTSFGSIIFFDTRACELRHSYPDRAQNNVRLELYDEDADGVRRALFKVESDGWTGYICYQDQKLILSSLAGSSRDDAAIFQIVPLERGLFALRFSGLFLSAQPDGRLNEFRTQCGLWESFLISHEWCSWDRSLPAALLPSVSRREIAKFIVDPRLRARVCRGSAALKVLIYGYPFWSHGRVYYDLCLRLHRRGYIVDIIDWQQNHAEYIADLSEFYDIFLTSPDGVRNLTDVYGIPLKRIALVLHHEMDTRALIQDRGIDIFEEFAGYGVVSDLLFSASIVQGIRREPAVVGLGINYEEFQMSPPSRLSSVGYASSMSVTSFGVEWKRGYLAKSAAEIAGLEFVVAGATGNQQSFVDMPDFYSGVEAIVTSSVTEAAGLPVMEAAAAGRLVICTPVGHFPQKAYAGAGILAPTHPQKFVEFVSRTLEYYRDNPEEFIQKCRSIQFIAKQFDWDNTIEDWVDFLEVSAIREN